jgi:acetyl esterase
MFFHGGGLMVGNLDTHDALCRVIADGSGRNLLAVEYRLAPEHKFPAAPEDCLAATRWALTHCEAINADPNDFALIGESSGGTMSAVVAEHLARDEGGAKPRLQVLTYPSLDMATDSPSYERFAEGFFFTRVKAQYFFSHYLNSPADADDPRASPLRAPSFCGVCPTLIIAGGLDPLLSEAAEYARRLQFDGVPVEFHCFEGWPHGFLFWGGSEAFERAVSIATRALHDGVVSVTEHEICPSLTVTIGDKTKSAAERLSSTDAEPGINENDPTD